MGAEPGESACAGTAARPSLAELEEEVPRPGCCKARGGQLGLGPGTRLCPLSSPFRPRQPAPVG